MTDKKPTRRQGRKRSDMISYAEPQLRKQMNRSLFSHSIYNNSPDKVAIYPNNKIEISTGLSIDTPEDSAIVIVPMLRGLFVLNHMAVGPQKDMSVVVSNYTTDTIELRPFEYIGEMYLTTLKKW